MIIIWKKSPTFCTKSLHPALTMTSTWLTYDFILTWRAWLTTYCSSIASTDSHRLHGGSTSVSPSSDNAGVATMWTTKSFDAVIWNINAASSTGVSSWPQVKCRCYCRCKVTFYHVGKSAHPHITPRKATRLSAYHRWWRWESSTRCLPPKQLTPFARRCHQQQWLAEARKITELHAG